MPVPDAGEVRLRLLVGYLCIKPKWSHGASSKFCFTPIYFCRDDRSVAQRKLNLFERCMAKMGQFREGPTCVVGRNVNSDCLRIELHNPKDRLRREFP